MNKKQLLKLAEFLETLPRKKFDMSVWTESKHKEHIAYSTKTKGDITTLEPNHCKTIGCAMGWAATIPSFKKAGLCLSRTSYYDINVILIKNGEILAYDGIEAAELFFDMDHETAMNLFWPDGYNKSPTPKEVAKKIRNVVEQGELT